MKTWAERKKVKYCGLGKKEYEDITKDLDNFFGGSKYKKAKLESIGVTGIRASRTVNTIARFRRHETTFSIYTLDYLKPCLTDEVWAAAVLYIARHNEYGDIGDQEIEAEGEAIKIIGQKDKKEVRKRRQASAMYYLERANRLAMAGELDEI